MVSGISRIFIGILLLAAATVAARADFSNGKMPDGAYHCEVYLLGMFLSLGDITIKGNVYSGPVYASLGVFGTARQGYNYQMDANGVISWLGPLGGYTAGGNSLSLTQATLDGETVPSFDIIMKQPDGAFTASTCTKQ
ncbi:MAG: hypothetical protein EOQ39_08045 [Mesorhizobium sp.]|uniref:hypothetical protein n=1 Tax=unclassified Mesorhizobium TaxID=325217 RepID=UPI000FD91889|nr:MULTISPECIES: hypothetical protein [unclassified Mesorhizobium]AZV22168.1 hypothetical protein EJ079_25635 [Mesorhizobium sp. M7A.F.Ce.TU.012.03.2.1]RWB05695.1 MAG: hypothetical protein EOQ37_15720 [Mesorhizobium sp.]RWB16468.1 MAG: hypothetical protein EOQ39_08045 [Mesorhizobium sp.]